MCDIIVMCSFCRTYMVHNEPLAHIYQLIWSMVIKVVTIATIPATKLEFGGHHRHVILLTLCNISNCSDLIPTPVFLTNL